MRAGVARDAFQPARGVDEALDLLVRLVDRAQLRRFLDRAVDRHIQRRRHQTGDAVRIAVCHAERAPNVPDRGLRAERAEGDDLGDVVVAVLLRRVADHLLAPVVREVHVHVRHLPPLDVEEALEDEVVGERVDVGDAEAVENEAGRRRSAHAHGDRLLMREDGEVVHDEHVVGEAGLAHDVQLVLQALANLFGGAWVASLQAGPGEIRQVLVGCQAGREVNVGQVEPAELQLKIASLRDALRVVDGLWQLGEAGAHLGLRLDVVDRRVHAHPLFVEHGGVRADAEQHVVVGRVVGVDVVAIDGGGQRDVKLAGELDELLVHGGDFVEAVLLQLQVVAVEHLPAPVRQRDRVVPPAVQEEAVHLAGVAAGEGDDARAVLLQQLPVHPRSVVVAFQVGFGHERQQVVVPLSVAGEQRQVVGRLLLRVTRAAVSRRDVRLHADDRFDATGARLLVEVDHPVERAVVGDSARLLPKLLDAIEQLGDAREAVEQAVFGVKVKVRKHLSVKRLQHRYYSSAWPSSGERLC